VAHSLLARLPFKIYTVIQKQHLVQRIGPITSYLKTQTMLFLELYPKVCVYHAHEMQSIA